MRGFFVTPLATLGLGWGNLPFLRKVMFQFAIVLGLTVAFIPISFILMIASFQQSPIHFIITLHNFFNATSYA